MGPCWRIFIFFEVEFPGFPFKFTVTPAIFKFSYRFPLKSTFFHNFWCTPWNSNDYYPTPWNFPLLSSTRGVKIFFWKSPFLASVKNKRHITSSFQYAHDVVLTSKRRRYNVMDTVWMPKRCRGFTGLLEFIWKFLPPVSGCTVFLLQ